MLTLRSSSAAKVANVFRLLSKRLKGTVGRPSAPLGSRILSNADDIFEHNMWDHVEWTEEEKENARQKVEENSCIQIPLKEQEKFDAEACQYWDKFYRMHQDKFFKDRTWLFLEFPELLPFDANKQVTNSKVGDQQETHRLPTSYSADTEPKHQQHADSTDHHRGTDVSRHLGPFSGRDGAKNEATLESFPGHSASFRILEVGCGVGNSVFPILNSIKGTDSFLYCCDFSQRAVQLVKSNPNYDESVCHAFVHDICEDTASLPFPPRSLDVILAVFVLSAIHPSRMQGVVNKLSTYLKHGGMFLFRDYGRFDLSQLRFKKGQCLSDHFYTRRDGTCVYFFTRDEVHDLFSKAGLEEVQNLEDKRLKVNRGKKIAMHRVWMQSKYRKSNRPS